MTHHTFFRCTAAALILSAGCLTAHADDDTARYLRHTVAAAWPVDSSLHLESIDYGDAATWWRTFNDPVLDSLIYLGRERNYNLAIAAKRIEMARAAVQQAQSGYYPQIGVSAGWTRARSSGRTAGPEGDATTVSYFNGQATMSWELDVFGKITQQVKKAKADVRVSAAEYEAAMVALDAEIASVYLDILVSRAQLDVAQRHAESQLHILDITETRHSTGLVSKLDVAQAKTLYYSTISSIPLLEASIEADYNALAVLLGTNRIGLPQAIFTVHTIPENYQVPVMGVPIDLLRRRPDIVEAERNIDAAAAALGIARSAYLPSLSISAAVGTQAHRLSDLFTGPSFTYSVAPTLSWTVFDGLARRAASREARQTLEIQVDNYNLTVLTAIQEVRNAIAKYTAEVKYITATKLVVENSEEAVRLSLDQYKSGLSDFYNLVEAQLNYLAYQNSLVEARGAALQALIDLYKALGGGYGE